MAKLIGQQLGSYRLISLLGEGGFADVYLAQHLHLDTQVAVKVLHTQLASEGIEQFRQEARLIARLEHPHIVHVQDFGVENGVPFLIMNYAPNGTLRQRHPKGTRVPLHDVLSYVKQVASALQYAHEHHIIHRAVKPENLLVGRNNEILLSDFGLALLMLSSFSRTMHDLAGTIAYMAPEQIEGHPHFSSDQYSLAVLTYEWLSGSRPFHGSFAQIATQHRLTPPPPLHEKVPTLPLTVEQVVLTALAKEHRQRFATIQAFATALEQALLPAGPSLPVSYPITPPASLPLISSLTESGTPQQPASAPARLITPQSLPILTPKISTTNPSTPPLNEHQISHEAAAERFTPSAHPVQPPQRSPSRRTVLLGLAGLVGAGVIGSGLVWLFRSQARTSSSLPSNGAVPVTAPILHPINHTLFGFDPQHTHFNPAEQTLSPATVAYLVRYWVASTGSTVNSSPSVSNGVVYIGSDDHKIHAFDAANGALRWSVLTGGRVYSSPAVSNGIVYIGSTDGTLYALDAATGVSRWKVATGNQIYSSPTVANGVVYIGSF
ncbi:MAG: protein kinase, partial [Chloroflexi bacterium]|nr:protein kinase [Chloroflexota bacterium]